MRKTQSAQYNKEETSTYLHSPAILGGDLMRTQSFHSIAIAILALAFIVGSTTIAHAYEAKVDSTPTERKVKGKDKDQDDAPKYPVEDVTFRQDGKSRSLNGRILLDAADGGVLLQSNDGILWTIQGNEVVTRTPSEKSFTPLKPDEMAEKVLAELPPGFRVHTTPHYVLCYDTSRQYALWTSSLLERLYRAFVNYWEGEGIKLREPEFPLVVLVFAERKTYDQMSREDLPGGAGNIIGYYSLRSNRINTFDLTGAEAFRGAGNRGSLREINEMLSQPAAVPLVATIVHEATHQIAFNSGLQTRYSDIPLWLCEGMAVYFEAPDLASKSGWRGIGKVNYPRLDTFRRNLGNWQNNTLKNLVSDNRRLRDPRQASDAYADAWALNYYLIKYQPKSYAAYLKALSQKPPLQEDSPATRLAEFSEYFGEPQQFEQDFLKQMGRVK